MADSVVELGKEGRTKASLMRIEDEVKKVVTMVVTSIWTCLLGNIRVLGVIKFWDHEDHI